MNGDADLVFVDTNVLLYALDDAVPAKYDQARAWLARLWTTGTGRVSWQVLHEFYFNATRKLGHPPAAMRQQVVRFASWKPGDVSLALLQRAWHWMDRANLAYWDALIVAAAEDCGATLLLSEDLQHGRRFGHCVVQNPFTGD